MDPKRLLYPFAFSLVLFTACTRDFVLGPNIPPLVPPNYTPTSTSTLPSATCTQTLTVTKTPSDTPANPTSTPTPTLAVGAWTWTPTDTPANPTSTPTLAVGSGTPTPSSTWSITTPGASQGSPTATYTPDPADLLPTFTPIPCLTYTNLSSTIHERHACPVVTTFQNKMWILPGFYNYNDTWSSPDGANWTRMSSTTNLWNIYNYNTMEFNGRLWSIGGNLDLTNPVPAIASVTSDGVNWSKAVTLSGIGARENMSLLNYNNRIWAIAGDTAVVTGGGGWRIQTNDVWSSQDGVNWTQATAHAAFGPRSSNGCVIFDNKMWIIAGANVQPYAALIDYYNDAWYSTDGVNWTAATQNAPFAPRNHAFVTVYNGEIWVMGGQNAHQSEYPLTDVWHSSDGVNWTQADNPCGVVFGDDWNWNFNGMIWGEEMVTVSGPLANTLRFFHL